MTSISLSYTPDPSPNRPSTPEDLWSFAGVNSFSGPSGTVILQNRRTDARMIVTSDVAQALSFCTHFRTIAQHVEGIEAHMPALRGQPEAIRGALQNVRDHGLLQSAKALLTELKSDDVGKPRNTPVKVFVLTCDRPDLLERLLSSMAKLPWPEEALGVWVIDDSKEKQASDRNREICNRQLSDIHTHYVGADQRAALIDHILQQLPQAAEALKFALDKDRWPGLATYGQARNLAQLLSVGYRAIVFDDDTVCQAVAPPLAERGLRFGSLREREAVLYDSAAMQERHKLLIKESPIALMAKSIGRSLSQVLTADGSINQMAAVNGVDGNELLRFNESSSAKLVQAGFWGDPGTGGANWLFYLPTNSLRRVLDDNTPLQTLIAARSTWAGFRGDTITPYGSMSAITGVDNTELMPPYLPVGRVEDLSFGIMLQRLHPNDFTYNCAWSVVHNPAENREDRSKLTPIATRAGLTNLIDWLGREPNDQWGLSAESRLLELSMQVRRLANMSEGALNTLVRSEVLSKQSALLQQTTTQTATCKNFAESANRNHWLKFLATSGEELGQSVQNASVESIDQAAAAVGGLDALRALGHEFADCLSFWPEIRSAAASFGAAN